MTRLLTRRGLFAAGSATAASFLAGCDRISISDAPSLRWFLDFGEFMSLNAQRLLLAGQPLVREYAEADITPEFPQYSAG